MLDLAHSWAQLSRIKPIFCEKGVDYLGNLSNTGVEVKNRMVVRVLCFSAIIKIKRL
jgi:hypothetical protein